MQYLKFSSTNHVSLHTTTQSIRTPDFPVANPFPRRKRERKRRKGKYTSSHSPMRLPNSSSNYTLLKLNNAHIHRDTYFNQTQQDNRTPLRRIVGDTIPSDCRTSNTANATNVYSHSAQRSLCTRCASLSFRSLSATCALIWSLTPASPHCYAVRNALTFT